jgi:hypothetical protein
MWGTGLAPRRVETTLPRSDGDDLIPVFGYIVEAVVWSENFYLCENVKIGTW